MGVWVVKACLLRVTGRLLWRAPCGGQRARTQWEVFLFSCTSLMYLGTLLSLSYNRLAVSYHKRKESSYLIYL